MNRAQQKTKTRQRVLNRAKRRFSREGFTQARTADIARAAAISHGALFVHFRSKEELMLAVVEDFGAELTDRLHALVKQGSSLREALTAHLRSLEDHEGLYLRVLLELGLLPAEVRARWTGIQSAIAFHLSAAAEREFAKGTLRRVEPSLFFNTWLGLIHHYLVNRDLFAPGASVLAKHGPALLEHYLRLLAP